MSERGPRPPSRRELEREVQARLDALTAAPTSLDPHNRPPLRSLLEAHRDWFLAGSAADTRDDRSGPPGPAIGLTTVVTLTLLGDVGTLFVSISVALNASGPAALAVAVALGTSAMFLAHQVGRWLHDRQHRRARLPGALIGACAVAWVAIGGVAATLRLAAPLNTVGGFGSGRTNAAAVAVVLAVLLFVLYTGNGLAAATLGFRTAGTPWPGVWQAWRRHRRDRCLRRRDRVLAWLRVLDARSELDRAAFHGEPSATDSLTVREEAVL